MPDQLQASMQAMVNGSLHVSCSSAKTLRSRVYMRFASPRRSFTDGWQALRRAGVRDPTLLLDEIDKLGADSARGDPAAALLEVQSVTSRIFVGTMSCTARLPQLPRILPLGQLYMFSMII